MAPREQVETIVRVQLGLRARRPSGHLVEDLGAESADVMNIICAIEERFGIEVDDAALARVETVDDLCALVAGAG